MDGLEWILIGLALGAGATYGLTRALGRRKGQDLARHQSSVLMERMKRVCKLVTVEGDFAEIYRYENIREGFMNILGSKKKALIVIHAKAQIGYDLHKLRMRADVDRKRIVLSDFPEPEVLSIEPDLQFYDIKNGLFNSFSPDDLTELNQKARRHIEDKIPESGLLDTARKEALEAVALMEQIVGTIGWTLDYSALEREVAVGPRDSGVPLGPATRTDEMERGEKPENGAS